MDLPTFIITLLGGGLLTAIITQFFSTLSVKKERRLKLLEEQTRELYAPLFYLVAQSEKLFELNARIHDAYKVEFIDKRYSENQLTQDRLKSSREDTIGLANDYVNLIEANNGKISDLLDNKFSYIDPDDVEIFLLFFEHRTRFMTERDNDGKLKTPDQIYEHLGNISYLRPEFIERVKSKFLLKKKELNKLLKT